eukprot:s383_g33.t1
MSLPTPTPSAIVGLHATCLQSPLKLFVQSEVHVCHCSRRWAARIHSTAKGMTAEPRRLPCPERIIDMVGFAFGCGTLGGFGMTFTRSLRDHPKGHRFSGALAAAQARAPQLGSTFALWSGLFHAFECAVSQRHLDPQGARSSIDAALCGFLTAGVLSVRQGPRVASMNAAVGAFCVALVDVVSGTARL